VTPLGPDQHAAADDGLAATLADRCRFVLDEASWLAFEQALKRPIQAKPRLLQLLREPGVLD
jgi:uncharacterized protein (DUF1778 family)